MPTFTEQFETASDLIGVERINRKQAARFLGTSVRTLNRYATNKSGPSFAMVGRYSVYRIEELRRWINSRENHHGDTSNKQSLK